MTELMTEYLHAVYPIKRMRIAHRKLVYHNLPAKGPFKRVIQISNGMIYRVSDKGDRYSAMQYLSKILCRTFRVTQEETMPVLKKYLYLS